MTGIAFNPLVPVPLVIVLLIAALALVGYGIWKRARGALLRALLAIQNVRARDLVLARTHQREFHRRLPRPLPGQ